MFTVTYLSAMLGMWRSFKLVSVILYVLRLFLNFNLP